MEKPIVVAEVGCNHMGDLELAKKFIKVAKEICNVDVVKFQKRDIKTWTERYPEQYNAPHPNPSNAYGETYKSHRENLEFDLEQHKILKEYCESLGVIYSTSVWDMKSAQEIASISPQFIKIPSACNTNLEMLEWLCDNYSGDIHISTGMTTTKEINDIVEMFTKKGKNKKLVLYNCTSGYPVPFEDICLLEINNLKDRYGEKVKQIGFSGHHLGIAVDVSAYTLGATIIERHFTLDRTWKGTDHAASLEPDGMRKIVRDLNAVHKALTYKNEEILPIEDVQRRKLKW